MYTFNITIMQILCKNFCKQYYLTTLQMFHTCTYQFVLKSTYIFTQTVFVLPRTALEENERFTHVSSNFYKKYQNFLQRSIELLTKKFKIKLSSIY